ncbi:Fe-S cluster assembly ATPase SufC, partial [Patescibacteria group bacterium]|nr:Fe-S cluster assembly ATPase SufC [Patescibacteria group bacterium]
MVNILKIENLHVSTMGQEILTGATLTVKSGEIHAIMGPNGSGKSTLCYAIMGHPNYKVTNGSVTFNGEDILGLSPDKRARLGLFLGFQYPREVPGVTFGNFVRHAVNAGIKANNQDVKTISVGDFYPIIQKKMEAVKMDKKFIGRSLNEGFSGGEKKRAEIVQMAVLKPKFAFLDEIDSGLDIDALKSAAEGIRVTHEETGMGVLLITHYQRILEYLTP